VIAVASGWWRFLLVILPAAFGAAAVAEFRRSAKDADEQAPT
jgi:hypothetical protein